MDGRENDSHLSNTGQHGNERKMEVKYTMVFENAQYRNITNSFTESTLYSQDETLEEVIWEAIAIMGDKLDESEVQSRI